MFYHFFFSKKYSEKQLLARPSHKVREIQFKKKFNFVKI